MGMGRKNICITSKSSEEEREYEAGWGGSNFNQGVKSQIKKAERERRTITDLPFRSRRGDNFRGKKAILVKAISTTKEGKMYHDTPARY